MGELGPRIASGIMSEVFAYGPGRVVKRYRGGCTFAQARREAEAAGVAHSAGVRTPVALEVVTINNHPGIVFERVDGPAMLDALMIPRYGGAHALAVQLADLHATVHAARASDLPPLRDRLRERIAQAFGLADDARSAALAALGRLPDGSSLCHGDFQPGNVVMSPEGPTVIDWFDATLGDPAADVARTLLIIRTAALPLRLDGDRGFASLRAAFGLAYLARTEQTRPDVGARVDAWLLPVAAARLAELVSEPERQAILALIRERLGPANPA
jgi:aminoglycoside phosphotransferase (APT) family kinase protein